MFMIRCIFWDEDMLQQLKMVLLLPLNYVQSVSRLLSHMLDNLPKKKQKKDDDDHTAFIVKNNLVCPQASAATVVGANGDQLTS